MTDAVAGSPAGGLHDDAVAYEVTSSERVFQGKIWDIRRETFAYGDGEITREFVDHTGAVAVLAIDDEDRVLLIKQYRHPVRMREWEIPAGLLDITGEPPLTAVQRELAEEADLVAAEWSVLAEYYTTPGGSDEAIRVYLARGLTPRRRRSRAPTRRPTSRCAGSTSTRSSRRCSSGGSRTRRP